MTYKAIDDCCGVVATIERSRYSRRTRRRWAIYWTSGRSPEDFALLEDAKGFIRRLRHSHNIHFTKATEGERQA